MSSAGADMQAVRNRWLKKRKSQMNKWLNGFKPKPPKKEKDKITERVAAHGVVVTCREQDNHHYYKIFADSVKTLLETL